MDHSSSNKRNAARGKDLLGVQLEVTERLLQSEEAKLTALKNELITSGGAPPGGTKAKELEAQQNNYTRIHVQFQRLSQELRQVGLQAISQKPGRPLKASRSLPAIGIKPTSKVRPSVFNNLVPKNEAEQEILSDHLNEPPKLNYKDGVIVSGSLEALIEEFYPTATHYPDHSYIFAFLLCVRIFLQPHELLAKVSRLTQMHHHKASKSLDKNNTHKVIELISEWTEMFPYDFRDERMMRYFKEITQLCACQSADLRKAVGQIQQTLVKELSVLDKYEHILAQVNDVAMKRRTDHEGQINILQVCEDPHVLAQQLCHVELERLNTIGPEEFVQTFVKETEPQFCDMKTTRNLEAYVEWFNRLSYLVSTEICVTSKKRDRAQVIEFFVQTAIQCYRLHNFNSCLAISIGLNMIPVSRLKKTLSKVNMSAMEEVEHLMDPTGNFNAYRTCLVAAMGSIAQDKQQTSGIIPVFSLLLKDIYFLNQGNKNKLPNGLINFEKFWALSRLITQILSYKNANYSQERVKPVLHYLMTVPVCNEDELYWHSYECESPDGTIEKKRYTEICASVPGRSKKRLTSSTSSTY